MSADLLLARIKLTIYGARWNDTRRYRSNLPSNSVCYSAFRDRRNCLGGSAFLFREGPPARRQILLISGRPSRNFFEKNFEAVGPKKAGFCTRRGPALTLTPPARTADTASFFSELKREFERILSRALGGGRPRKSSLMLRRSAGAPVRAQGAGEDGGCWGEGRKVSFLMGRGATAHPVPRALARSGSGM